MDELTVSTKKTSNAVLIAGIAIVFVLPIILTEIIATSNLDYIDRIFYSRFIYWLDSAVIVLYAYFAEHQKPLLWRAKQRDIGFFIVSVIVLYFLSLGCSVVSLIPKFLGWKENDDVIKKLADIFRGRTALIIFISLTAGVTEEFLFRGYILTRLSLVFKNKYLPIIVSAILFSALHYRYHSLREYIVTFSIGLLYGAYYQKYRNIVALMAVHFLVDFISLELATHFTLK